MIETINQEKCIGCGTCVEFCPLDVFRMNEIDDISMIKYREHCQTCFTCELECPEHAIHVNATPRKKIQPW